MLIAWSESDRLVIISHQAFKPLPFVLQSLLYFGLTVCTLRTLSESVDKKPVLIAEVAMTDYRFVTIWRLTAPIDTVWRILRDSRRWSEWWPYVTSMDEIEPGDADVAGALHRITWKTPLGYALAFNRRTTIVKRHQTISGGAFGELERTGTWTLSEESGVTTVRYDWNVRTTKCWINLVAPVARPLFVLNHDRVMTSGGQGLARESGATLLSE